MQHSKAKRCQKCRCKRTPESCQWYTERTRICIPHKNTWPVLGGSHNFDGLMTGKQIGSACLRRRCIFSVDALRVEQWRLSNSRPRYKTTKLPPEALLFQKFNVLPSFSVHTLEHQAVSLEFTTHELRRWRKFKNTVGVGEVEAVRFKDSGVPRLVGG